VNKNKLNFWFDVVLFVFFLVTIVSLFGTERADALRFRSGQALDQEPFILQTRVVVHSAAGALMLIGSAVHIASHWEWITAVVIPSPRKLAKRVRAKRGIDIWLFVFAILCSVTGVMALLMQGFLPNPFVFSLRAWSGLHRLTGMMMFLIMLVHLAQHWKWIVSTTQRRLEIGASKRQRFDWAHH
jgi:cytochrome b subunit of formate dehydrogenase